MTPAVVKPENINNGNIRRSVSKSSFMNTEILDKYEIENSKAKLVMGRKILSIEEKIERLRQQILRLEKDKKKVVKDYESQREKNYSKMISNALMI